MRGSFLGGRFVSRNVVSIRTGTAFPGFFPLALLIQVKPSHRVHARLLSPPATEGWQ